MNAGLENSDISGDDIARIKAALPDIIASTPKTDGAVSVLRKVGGKIGTAAYDVVVKVVSDVGSETAKKMMGL